MIFEYKPYYNNLVRAPIIQTIFLVLSIIVFSSLLVQYYRQKMFTKKNIALFTLAALFGIWAFTISFPMTNLDLIKDDPNETVSTCGVIQSVDEPRHTPRYHYNGDVVRPRILTINNEEYYIAYNGRYNTNAYVEIEYLPNSKVIMAIKYCEE